MLINKTMKSMTPNDLGKKFLVEDCQKISINVFLQNARKKLKEALITSEIEANDMVLEFSASSTPFGGERLWFKCPSCGLRVGTLFVHPLNQQVACRICLNLEYRSRQYKGMVENSLHRGE